MSEFQTEIKGGATPGAVRSIAYWKNLAGEPVPRSQAVMVEIHEFDKDGDLIQTTHAHLGD